MTKNIPVLWILYLLVALVTGIGAETIYVDVANAGDPEEDGSIAHPFDAIQEGIDAAAASGDTVQVAAGTYRENLVWDTKSLILQGAGAGNSIVDGREEGRCLTLTNVPETGRVEGFTFQNGVAENGGGLSLAAS